MANDNYTAVLMINDVSGSMQDHAGNGSRYQVAEEALHLMLERQARKLAGYITVDVTYFDDGAYEGQLDADPMLVNLGLYASGWTYIYDGVGKLLPRFEKRLNDLPEDEKPGHVVVIIMTDGRSDAPREAEGYNVSKTIANLKSIGWDFAYLAIAGDKATHEHTVKKLGLTTDCMVVERPTAEGISNMADKVGEFISMTRSGEKAHF